MLSGLDTYSLGSLLAPPILLCPRWDLWSAEQPQASAVLRQVIRRRLGQVRTGQQSGGRNKTFIMTKNVEFSDLVNYSDLHMYATFQISVSILRM